MIRSGTDKESPTIQLWFDELIQLQSPIQHSNVVQPLISQIFCKICTKLSEM